MDFNFRISLTGNVFDWWVCTLNTKNKTKKKQICLGKYVLVIQLVMASNNDFAKLNILLQNLLEILDIGEISPTCKISSVCLK